ncbi:MAG: WlaTC/HtrL family glycosyltransferase [Deltaproteobacteria bacterium]|nr:WlaTC/HtrL family glycosyltransferase [Deltaproteobacteria bacterium]
MQDLTLVTGLFDLGRGAAVENLGSGFVRPFESYLENFARLLAVDVPMSIYVEPAHEAFVWRHRRSDNTRVFHRSPQSFRSEFPFYDRVQEIRRDPAWRARAGWLAESPQANLELYNPMVMSKMGMLHDQSIINPFGSSHLLWIDAGLANTCAGYLGDARWPARIVPLLRKFLFVCFPYEDGYEIHGFDRRAIADLARTDHVRWVARGGLFGGARHAIPRANALYYRLLEISLAQGEMGTEESIFSIMTYREPQHYDRFHIQADGLLGTFFHALIHEPVRVVTTEPVAVSPQVIHSERPKPRAFDPSSVDLDRLSTALYVVTFNSPPQLRLLLDSWTAQPEFLTRTTRYLIDNSTDLGTTPAYAALCEEFGFVHLKRDNVGICGARQLAADHFAAGPHDYMFFLEDDMLAQPRDAAPCANGFPGWVEGLYEKALLIMEKEGFDFLKLCFTEAYGSNAQQWAWYNVPPRVRREVWPESPSLPHQGFAEAIPATRFDAISSVNGLPYASGEVYYANWPQVVSRAGNQRMFLDSRWARPFEQTWMSHMFQLSRAGTLRSAVLLASPIRHCRVHHYVGSERKES